MVMKLEDVAELLPESVQQMVDLVGFPTVEKIITHFGGATFRFTDGVHYFPKLKELIGLENAMKLREVFRGEWLYIPRCQTALRVLRNYHFKADYDHLTQTKKTSGRMAMLELCPKYQISDRKGWEILAKVRHPEAISNLALF
ncbi:mor transcription activator family protein [Rodentibacter genomosp. 1]|uniref:Mor transcription activator family protein n=1 Tax=Rodentibacter genomosp. 1 TaxID=1908264 RepID=A0A1V3J5V8_9PAST|nr:Mor transcription activator family protein [Rodentibacter genomosp. 1]OOF50285.1 mor transcription activator family protein [Rodentibacter genomosp. 1]